MARVYRSAPLKAAWIADEDDCNPFFNESEKTIQVYEPRDGWKDSGLLDASGTPLMSKDEREPVGFLRFGQ